MNPLPADLELEIRDLAMLKPFERDADEYVRQATVWFNSGINIKAYCAHIRFQAAVVLALETFVKRMTALGFDNRWALNAGIRAIGPLFAIYADEMIDQHHARVIARELAEAFTQFFIPFVGFVRKTHEANETLN
jgi:hypothetical protein